MSRVYIEEQVFNYSIVQLNDKLINDKEQTIHRLQDEKKTLQTSPKSCTIGLLKNKRKNQDEVHLFSINPYAEWKTGFSN